jgi:hypothetical protein
MRSGIYLWIFFLVCFTSHCNAISSEKAQIDSLLTELKKTNSDSLKFYIYSDILNCHISYKTEEGLKYGKPALELAEKLENKNQLISIRHLVGKLYWRLGKFELALREHNEMLRIARQQGNIKKTALAFTDI